MTNDQLHLIIKNRETTLFDGSVFFVSSFNELGRFDVLPQHTNFISLIKEKISYQTLDGEEKSITLNNGIIRVESNSVEVYLGIGK